MHSNLGYLKRAKKTESAVLAGVGRWLIPALDCLHREKSTVNAADFGRAESRCRLVFGLVKAKKTESAALAGVGC